MAFAIIGFVLYIASLIAMSFVIYAGAYHFIPINVLGLLLGIDLYLTNRYK